MIHATVTQDFLVAVMQFLELQQHAAAGLHQVQKMAASHDKGLFEKCLHFLFSQHIDNTCVYLTSRSFVLKKEEEDGVVAE